MKNGVLGQKGPTSRAWGCLTATAARVTTGESTRETGKWSRGQRWGLGTCEPQKGIPAEGHTVREAQDPFGK